MREHAASYTIQDNICGSRYGGLLQKAEENQGNKSLTKKICQNIGTYFHSPFQEIPFKPNVLGILRTSMDSAK